MRVTSRTADFASPAQEISGLVRNNDSYAVSAWVRIRSGTVDAQLAATSVFKKGEETVTGPLVTVGTEWTRLDWNWEYREGGQGLGRLDDIFLHLITPGSRVDLNVDDVRLTEVTGSPDYAIKGVVLGPTSNPFGATNGEGIYMIECDDRDLTIEDTRIIGTLILTRPGPNTTVQGSVVWEPAAPGQPILLVPNGSITIDTDDTPLGEDAEGINFNPDGSPYPWDDPDAVGDADTDDLYDSQFRGLIAVSNAITFDGRPMLTGVVIAGGSVEIDADRMDLNFDPDVYANPPAGLGSSSAVAELVAGSWERVVRP